MENTQQHPLGTFIRDLMTERQISGNALAQAISVNEGTIRNVLKYGNAPKTPAPSPAILRGLAEFFEIKVTWLYQLMGYLKPEDLIDDADIFERFIAQRIATLPPTQQKLLMDMVFTMEKSAGMYLPEQDLLDYLYQGRELRQRHSNWLEEVDRRISKIFHPATPELFVVKIVQCLSKLMEYPVREKDVLTVTDHPTCRMILNVLFPRKDMPTSLEKLYHLTYLDEQIEINPTQAQAICEIWQLLINLANERQKVS